MPKPQTVTYHGSVTLAHGPAEVVGECWCFRCQSEGLIRWELRPVDGTLIGDRTLLHVRAESFA